MAKMTKEEKQAEKAIARAEKAEITQLKSAQKAETVAIKAAGEDAGLSKKEIKELVKAEEKVNKAELGTAKETLNAAGQQTLRSGENVPITSNLQTLEGDIEAAVQKLITDSVAMYDQYNLAEKSVRGDTTSGIGLDKLVQYNVGEAGTSLTKLLGRAETFTQGNLTEQQLTDEGVKLKEVKNNPGVFVYKTGSDEVKLYSYFVQNADGTYTNVYNTRTVTDIDGGLFGGGGFLGLGDLGTIVAIAASYFGGPVGAAAVNAVNTATYGGDFGDVLKSAGTAYFSSQIQAGVFDQAINAGFTVTQAAAAASAATSAVVTAVQGGDVSDILSNAGTAAIAATVANTVQGEFNNRALTNFVQSAVTGILKDQDFADVLLQATGSAAAGYLQDYQAMQNRLATITARRLFAYTEYIKNVNDLNRIQSQMASTTDPAQLAALQDQANLVTANINQLGNQLVTYMQDLADLEQKAVEFRDKFDQTVGSSKEVEDEAFKLVGSEDFQDKFINQIQDTARSIAESTPEGQVQLAQADLGETMTDVAAGMTGRVEITGVPKTIYEDENVRINEAGLVFDKETGDIITELTPEQVELYAPQTKAFLDLRDFLGISGQGEAVIGGGGVAQTGGSRLPISLLGVDATTGAQNFELGGEVFTLITLPNGEQVLRSTVNNVFLVPSVVNEDLTFTPVDPDIVTRAVEESVGRPGGGGGGGAAPGETAAISGGEGAPADDLDRQIQDIISRQTPSIAQMGGEEADIAERRSAIEDEILRLIEASRRPGTEDLPTDTKETDIGAVQQGEDTAVGAGEEEGGIRGVDTGRGEGVGGGVGAGEGAGEGTGTGGGVGSGTGTGTGSGAGEGEGEGTGEEAIVTEETGTETPIFSRVTGFEITPPTRRTPPATTRVTGEALEGILGRKKPLFGADEDEQQAVWNRRSLRLRRALGL